MLHSHLNHAMIFIPDVLPTGPAVCDSVCSRGVDAESAGHSSSVQIDPDGMLSPDERSSFRSIVQEYVFDANYRGYNVNVRPFEAVVNIGPVEPLQRKGHLPQYAFNQLAELQNKFDELESMGVFVRPKDVPITVEYLNPSILVKKRNESFRLVTAFTDVGRYRKPQPALMPDVDSTLCKIAQWKHIISTDLSNAFYQIPLSHNSMRYCGVVTLFRGVRVYARCAMGMPASKTAVEELRCRVLGDLLEEGVDGTPTKLQKTTAVPGQQRSPFIRCKKTTICPSSTVILGWVWHLGTIQASPHRIATLARCDRPSTVKSIRSFIAECIRC